MNANIRSKFRFTQHIHNTYKDLLLLGVCFVIAILTRLPNLRESLWYDETWSTFIYLNSRSLYNILFQDVHPFLYPLIIHWWIRLIGDSEIAIRLPSLLFGLGSLGIIFLLAQQWFNRRTALLATVFMALSPVHIWYSQEAKNNMLLLLLTVLVIHMLQRAWMSNRWHYWLLFMVVTVCALWTSTYAVWVVSAAFLWLWIQVVRRKGRAKLKWAVMTTIMVAFAYFPVFLSILLQLNRLARGYLRAFTLAELYKLFLIYLSHGNTIRTISPYAPFHKLASQPWGFFLIEAFFLLLLIKGGLAIGQKWWREVKQPLLKRLPDKGAYGLFLCYLLIPPSALLLFSFLYAKNYIERSMIIMLPPFAIALACGIMAFSRKWRYGVLAVLLILNIWGLYHLWIAKADTWTVYKQNPDWRTATFYLAEQFSTLEEQAVIIPTSPTEPLRYYHNRWRGGQARSDHPLWLPVLYYENKKSFQKEIAAWDVGVIYLIHNQYWSGTFHRIFKNLTQEANFQFVTKTTFKGIEIFQFQRIHKNP